MADSESDVDDIPLEESLLLCSRRGQLGIIQDILSSKRDGKIEVDINCKGTQKSNRGWTPLHLASYFGHKDVVELLLQNGALVNAVNNVGDTPLHRAAHTGRLDEVTVLLQYGADVNVINAEGKIARAVTNNGDIVKLIEAAEKHEESRLEEEFMSSVRLGELDRLEDLAKKAKVNCKDSFGNTALHVAAQAGQQEVAVFLLQKGINSDVKNKQGQAPSDVAKTESMKQLLTVKPKSDVRKAPPRFEGVLIKRSFVGAKGMWVVLERGVLSFFKNRGDAATGSKRLGMKYLDEAEMMVHSQNDTHFVVRYSDGTAHKLQVDSKAGNYRIGREPGTGEKINRQMWINALKDHIHYNTHYIHTGKGKRSETEVDLQIASLEEAIKVSQAHQDVLKQQVTKVSSHLSKTQATDRTATNAVKLEFELQKIVSQSTDMCSSLQECLLLFKQQEEVKDKLLHEEREKNRVLQEALHALAIEHHELERSYSKTVLSRAGSINADEFFDCDDDAGGFDFHRPLSPSAQSRLSIVSEALSFKSCQFDVDDDSDPIEVFDPVDIENDMANDMEAEHEEGGGAMKRGGDLSSSGSTSSTQFDLGGRTKLPVPMFDRNNFSIWSILKQCVGKELSKITMPVVFNEPLTFLQRISEYLEYASLLDMACTKEDPAERMMYVAAFAVSAISSNWERIGKPFNPLLGETYELDRPDLGFRLVSEQVCHHPPISAFHIEAKNYKFHGSIHPKLKFWGRSVEINPKGVLTLELTKFGETYTWQNVNCCVHNVIVGKIWIEHTGVMEVYNHKLKYKAVLDFKKGGWFGKDLHKVEGYVVDPNKTKVKALYGSWIYDLFGVDYGKYEDYMRNRQESPNHTVSENGSTSKSSEEDNIPTTHMSTFNLNIPDQWTLWQSVPRPEHSTQYFSFTNFSMALNELKDYMLRTLPPTDSRLRPDVRILEEGNIDLAGEEKNRIEEKQRGARRERKKKRDDWNPIWFKLGVHPETQKEDWIFVGKYWDREWSRCPDIF